MKLRRVRGIDKATHGALASCHLYTVRDLLSCTVIELVQMLDLREDQVQDLLALVSKRACPRPREVPPPPLLEHKFW